MARVAPRAPSGSPPSRRRVPLWPIVLGAVALFALNYWIASRAVQPQARVRVPYSPFFLAQVRAGNVRTITSTGAAVQGDFKQSARYPAGPGGAQTTQFSTEIPAFADTDALSRLLQSKGVVINANPLDAGVPWWQSLLYGFGPTLLLLGLMFWIFRRALAGGGGLLSCSASRGHASTTATGTKPSASPTWPGSTRRRRSSPRSSTSSGTRRSTGDSGPHPARRAAQRAAGDGEDAPARAVAGEAGVPFFSMSASEFIEMIVGVGASRVRDLFQQAKQAAPAIVFIDELDAIGRSRSAAFGGLGGHDEREQTLNQILTEMDGFDSSAGVIVIGATNRPDVLDGAAPAGSLRSPRRRPAARPARAQAHPRGARAGCRSRPRSTSTVAATTAGMVGADLANLANEAALLAARRSHARIGTADFNDALERIVLGAACKIVLSDADRRRTAVHEAGHAIVGMLTPEADRVRKVSIIPAARRSA